MQIQPTDLH